ncbi:MAG: phage portal protein [Phycisphaerales bacterium]|nr:phage portal protein [Phycisphaerales bacterium]
MLKRLLAPLSRQADPVRAASATPHRARMVRARFDSAQTTADNRRHWAAADGLSPNAAVSPEVRRILRNRARYEVANNSYAKGIVLTLANDTIGTGPRLQMLTPDSSVNARVEEAFEAWSAAIDLSGKLRTMRMARAESGEAFGLLISSPALDTPVKLDLRLLEPDQVATPAWSMEPGAGSSKLPADRSQLCDGIVFDASGLPVAYHVLRRHPGDGAWNAVRDHDTYPAASVLHYFRPDRPGQWRGIPDITPALPLFAQLRRYTLAVIAAAETAADFAAVLYTDAPASGEADPLEPMDEVELEKRMATVLPGGWKLGQVHAEHPSTTYGEFKREILNEIARCLNMPFNVAAGNSSGYNYASGRLDHQTYFKSIRVEQHRLQQTVLDRLLRAWLDEAALVEGLLPQAMRVRGAAAPHVWFWDGVEHVDPAKEANAQATRLANHTTTLAHEFARQGRDWEDELRQRAKELALMRELGLPLTGGPGDTTDEAVTDDTSTDEAVTDEAIKEAA